MKERLPLAKIVENIEFICRLPLDEIAASILPIVTQARVDDDYIDLNLCKMLVQQQVVQQFMGQSYVKRHFFCNLTERVILFDPLDRPIPDVERDWTIKSDELRKMIEKQLKPMMNQNGLIFPLDKDINEELNNMMEEKFQKCKNIADTYKKEKKEKPNDYMQSFRDHPDVIEIKQITDFFEGNKLEVFDSKRSYQIQKMVEQTSAMENFIQYQ